MAKASAHFCTAIAGARFFENASAQLLVLLLSHARSRILVCRMGILTTKLNFYTDTNRVDARKKPVKSLISILMHEGGFTPRETRDLEAVSVGDEFAAFEEFHTSREKRLGGGGVFKVTFCDL